MANVLLSRSFNFLSDQDWEWVVTSATGSNITFNNTFLKQTFTGNFTYDDNDIVYGTATSTSFYNNNALVYSVSEMSANASRLQVFAETIGDTQETYAYVLRGDDTFTGSSGDDVLIGYGGNDTVNYNSNLSSANITYNSFSDQFTIVTVNEGTDIVSGIEFFQFTDQLVNTATITNTTISPTRSNTEAYLATYGVSMEQGRAFILANIENLANLFNVAKQFGITNQMLADIYGGVSADAVKYFFQTHGFNPTELDATVSNSNMMTAIPQNDNISYAFNSLIIYTPTQSGVYYLTAGDSQNIDTDVGTYQLSAIDFIF